ncbi:uncharacterized protein [Triticum aestivum]|uniref:uncharacterized protein isoform X2 n=1 Tax=Triticum aestivum TaxID=4565 RepID=UPI001D032C31|nr:uncharacterized protein LOC123150430 isoform X2 [Triticum aestivum]
MRFSKEREVIQLNVKLMKPLATEEIPVPPPLLLLEFEQHGPHPSMPQQQGHQTQTNEVQFRGIEFLQRDPALRPQIWQYPPNQRDDVRRAYLKLGIMQPRLKDYKAYGPEGRKRRFKYDWFKDFPSWLEYSEDSHRAYCFYCFLFSNNKNKRGGSDVFTVRGFVNWKKVHDGKKCAFLNHIGSEPCSVHNNATKAYHDFLNQQGHLGNVVAVGNERKTERNQLRVKVSIAAVKWLTSQSCAFRGHDETPESKNKGNFIELLKLLAEFNPEIAEVILENAPYSSKYTSHEIQQEILGIYAFKVRKHIREEIGNSKFSILVDETCDVAKREQMALVLRFVDEDRILQERFFDLIHVTNTKAATLKEVEYAKGNSSHGKQHARADPRSAGKETGSGVNEGGTSGKDVPNDSAEEVLEDSEESEDNTLLIDSIAQEACEKADLGGSQALLVIDYNKQNADEIEVEEVMDDKNSKADMHVEYMNMEDKIQDRAVAIPKKRNLEGLMKQEDAVTLRTGGEKLKENASRLMRICATACQEEGAR